MKINKVRKIVEFENHFSNFLKEQPEKVQNTIFKVIEAIETLERIPAIISSSSKEQKGCTKLEFNLAKISGECSVSSTMIDW
jgi:hypothetical protein